MKQKKHGEETWGNKTAFAKFMTVVKGALFEGPIPTEFKMARTTPFIGKPINFIGNLIAKLFTNPLSRLVLNPILRIFTSGFIVGKFLSVMFTWLTLVFAENSKKSTGLASFGWGVLSTVFFLLTSLVFTAISTIFSRDRPSVHLTELNSNLDKKWLNRADFVTKVLKTALQAIGVAAAISVLIILTQGVAAGSLAIYLQGWISTPFIGSVIVPAIMESSLAFATIKGLAIAALSGYLFTRLYDLLI